MKKVFAILASLATMILAGGAGFHGV